MLVKLFLALIMFLMCLLLLAAGLLSLFVGCVQIMLGLESGTLFPDIALGVLFLGIASAAFVNTLDAVRETYNDFITPDPYY